MNHIAMLLPREELVYQARLQARGHDAVTEIRCIATEHAVEEAAASIRGGASILIARGLQALRIRAGLNVPVVSIRLTAQGIGMLLRKVRTLTDNPRPRVAMVVVDDMLCDTSCCELLFGVELQIFTYRTEEEYAQVNRTALDSCPDVIIGGDVTLPLWMGGKINAANRAARINEQTARSEGVQQRNALISELVERYYGLALAQQVVEVRKQILQIYHSEQRVGIAACHGIYRMRVAVHAGTYLVARHAGIEPHQIVAVCHYRLDGTVSKREYTSDDTLLDLLHLAVLGTLLYDRLDLGLGNLRVGLLQMEDARHELDASRQQPYER